MVNGSERRRQMVVDVAVFRLWVPGLTCRCDLDNLQYKWPVIISLFCIVFYVDKTRNHNYHSEWWIDIHVCICEENTCISWNLEVVIRKSTRPCRRLYFEDECCEMEGVCIIFVYCSRLFSVQRMIAALFGIMLLFTCFIWPVHPYRPQLAGPH